MKRLILVILLFLGFSSVIFAVSNPWRLNATSSGYGFYNANISIYAPSLFFNSFGFIGAGTNSPRSLLDIYEGVAINNQPVILNVGENVPMQNTISWLFSIGVSAQKISATLGSDGLPIISFSNSTSGYLEVLHCGNILCNSGNILTTVDSSATVGYYSAIIIGQDGLPVISHMDSTNGDLKVVHCGNIFCNSGNRATTVDSTGSVGMYTSIAIGSDGFPIISYMDSTNGDLKVLHCGKVLCNASNTATTIDSTGLVGYYTSITIGSDGLPLVSYQDSTNGDLKVVHCGSLLCSAGNTITTVDSVGSVGMFTSITIGSDGLGIISYQDSGNNDLKVLHCGNILCSAGNTITTVDSVGTTGWFATMMIGSDNLPIITYQDSGNSDLKVVHCGNLLCSSSNSPLTLESTGNVGFYSTIIQGSDSLPIIFYLDLVTNYGLKVLHCGSTSCLPYWTRR